MSTRRVLATALLLLGAATFLRANAGQTQAPAPQTPARPNAAADEGIPIANDVVVRVCGECHDADAKQRMSRISYRRTTPEGWQETIRRMATLNKAQIEPADARVIVKYLADNLGLAPEEARPGAFETERRMIDYTYSANTD